MGVSPQVIYKKFNIPCPLDNGHHNVTLHPDTVSNGTDFCEAKLFTMNSQVREQTFSASRTLNCQLGFCVLVSRAESQPHVLH